MFEDVLEQVGPKLERIVEFAGMELVHVEARRESGGTILRLYIDREGGVTLEDCARVSRQVSAELDADDPLPGRYTLEVSSPGLDRPLVRPADYTRFLGKEAQVQTHEALAGRKRFKGTLAGADAVGIRIDVDGVSYAITYAQIERAKLVPEI